MLIIFVFLVSIPRTLASTNCEPPSAGNPDQAWATLHQNFELSLPSMKVTLGSNLADWAVLYTYNYVQVGFIDFVCSESSGLEMYYTLLSQPRLVAEHGGHAIFATNVKGIGISIEKSPMAGGFNSGGEVKPYPDKLDAAPYGEGGGGIWVVVTYWKIPGEKIPFTGGTISVTGPDIGVIASNGQPITSSSPDRITGDGLSYINGSRILQATVLFQSPTCLIEGNNLRVDMGKYEALSKEKAPWRDASFNLTCPDGFGYNGSADSDQQHFSNNDPTDSVTPANVTIHGNTEQNGQVSITIVPYTEVLDANTGVIGLDGGGAQGYGIQLAWGDYAAQNDDTPAMPVILNTPIYASKLNSNFRAGNTPIGDNAFTGGDNTIKMAARYIRSSGRVMPGKANAAVQVIATYE